MGAIETTLIGGVAAVGGWFAWKKMHEWSPDGAGAGDAIARNGTNVSNQLGRVTEWTGVVAGGAIRTGGELVAKGAGLTVGTAGAVVSKAVPGRPKRAEQSATPVVEPPPAERSFAEKGPAKTTAAKKTAAKKTAAKKTAAK